MLIIGTHRRQPLVRAPSVAQTRFAAKSCPFRKSYPDVLALQKYAPVIVLQRGRRRVDLEPQGRAYHRSVYDVVEYEFGCTGTLRIVCRQGAKSNVAIDRNAVGHTEQPVVGANCLPCELATSAEAANVAAEYDLLARRQLMPHASTDERIDPIDGAG